jgi:hypothetical protein
MIARVSEHARCRRTSASPGISVPSLITRGNCHRFALFLITILVIIVIIIITSGRSSSNSYWQWRITSHDADAMYLRCLGNFCARRERQMLDDYLSLVSPFWGVPGGDSATVAACRQLGAASSAIDLVFFFGGGSCLLTSSVPRKPACIASASGG